MKRSLCVWLMATAGIAAELPVREVVLFKHGVGYFERSGRLAAGESARLEFKAAEMDDVLKSLTLAEQGGGAVSGLRYDASEPLARRLAEFPFRLDNAQPLSAVLDQLKGARLELKFATETVAGAIVGARVVPASEKQPEREQVALLLDSGDLRSFDLAAATAIRFADAKLQARFRDYLAALADSRSREKRSVYIDSTAAGARTVRAAYMIPMPVWKSSYRLLFGEDGQATLEGWAIVDNTTGEDWTNVRLALVSGRPISFVSRLYEPRYVNRPGAELPEDKAQPPVVYEGAVQSRQFDAGRLRAGGNVGGVPGGVVGGLAAAPSAGLQLKGMEMPPSTIAAPAAARELGELFEYRIAAPVTVRQNESAMLPFLQQKVEARKLLIYSDPSSVNPMNAAEIVNATGKTLDGGPITVYDGGGYAGEALVETVKTGDRRLISYAVDLGTRITTRYDSTRTLVRELHARRGVITRRVADVETRTYTAHNVDQKAKTLIIQHPARPQYNLVEPKAPERTPSAYRFEVKLAPGATAALPVTEERVYDTSLAVTNLTPDLLVSWVENKSLSDAARRQLEQVLDRKRQIADVDGELGRIEKQTTEMNADQERVRRNIMSLNQVSGQQQQVQAYARQLAEQETRLAALRDRTSELRKQRAALETGLNALIDKLAF